MLGTIALLCNWGFLVHAQQTKTNKIASKVSQQIIAAKQAKADAEFFGKKKQLLTATWNAPFSYNSIKTNNAPIGPYMGNGDVGVVCHTTDNSQTFHLSKVDFVTDGWSDWAGNGPAALPVGGVQITVNSATVATGFNYQMDQLGNELRMATATAQPVNMKSWMAVNENILITELTTTSRTPVSIAVETFADTATATYATHAGINQQVGQVTRQTKTTDVRWISKAGVSTRIVGATSVLSLGSQSKVNTSFVLTNTKSVFVITYLSGGGKGNDAQLAAAYVRLKSINNTGINILKAAKVAWWKDMWSRSYVETNDDLLNRHYLSSIYFLASAYNEHSPACGGMYGVWNMDDKMMYHGDIHLNYNSEAGFYSVFSANPPKLPNLFTISSNLLCPMEKDVHKPIWVVFIHRWQVNRHGACSFW